LLAELDGATEEEEDGSGKGEGRNGARQACKGVRLLAELRELPRRRRRMGLLPWVVCTAPTAYKGDAGALEEKRG